MVGATLARARQIDRPGDFGLRRIRLLDDARGVQEGALSCHGGSVAAHPLAESHDVHVASAEPLRQDGERNAGQPWEGLRSL